MADTITLRTDLETEAALAILTTDGSTRSAAIRQAVIDAAERQQRAAAMRRAFLRRPLGEPDGLQIADYIIAEREAGS